MCYIIEFYYFFDDATFIIDINLVGKIWPTITISKKLIFQWIFG